MRAPWGRGERGAALPAESLPGERVLARAELADGRAVVATQWALHLPAEGREVSVRVPWERVLTGIWSGEVLSVVFAGADDAKASRELRLQKAGELPAVLRERVSHSIVTSERRRLRRGDARTTEAVFVARRSPRTGDLHWTVAFLDPVAARDPSWQQAAASALIKLRGDLGIG